MPSRQGVIGSDYAHGMGTQVFISEAYLSSLSQAGKEKPTTRSNGQGGKLGQVD